MKKLNLEIGGYKIYPIPTGQFGLDGGVDQKLKLANGKD